MVDKIDWEAPHIVWWESFTLEEKWTMQYLYCIGREISPLEFELNDIYQMWVDRDKN